MRRLNQIFDLGDKNVSPKPEFGSPDSKHLADQTDGVDGFHQDAIYSDTDQFGQEDTLEAGQDVSLNQDSFRQETPVPWRKNIGARKREKSQNLKRIRNRISLVTASILGISLVIGGFWALTTGRLDVAKFQLKNSAEASLGSFGLTLQEFVLQGERHYTTKTQIRESLNTSRGEPILAVDPGVLRQRLLTLPWVKEAMVERVLPNSVLVTLEEHKPLAIWQFKGQKKLLDEAGNPIEVADLELFSSLPLLIGKQANEFAPEFIDMISKVRRLSNRVKVAQFVNGRRWTLKLDNDMLILLPELNALDALNRVAILDKTDSLLSRDVLEIDLRLDDRLVVRPNSGADVEIRSGSDVSSLGERT